MLTTTIKKLFLPLALGAAALLPASAPAPSYGRLAMHILMGAYFAHLLARTIYLTISWQHLNR